MVYTSKSFNNFAKSPDFQGWSGELQDDLKETKIVVDQLKLRQGNSLLDVACGYGRTSILFASNHGLKVTGIDISPGLIEIAKKTALKRGLDIEYILGDPVHAPWHDGFNGVCVLFNSLSVFSPQDVNVVLSNIRKPPVNDVWFLKFYVDFFSLDYFRFKILYAGKDIYNVSQKYSVIFIDLSFLAEREIFEKIIN